MKVVDKDFESKKKVSICMLTLDRYFMTKYAFERMVTFIDDSIEVQLLVLDNGSQDKRVVDYFKAVADVHIQETENIGVAKGLNKLLKQCTGDYICIAGNDICLSENWLTDLIYYNDIIIDTGFASIYRDGVKGHFLPRLTKHDTMANIWETDGNNESVKLFKKEVLDVVGGFDETLSLYGHETNQFALRLSMLGKTNYFIPDQNSMHLGAMFNEKTEYAKMKEHQYQLGRDRFESSVKEMKKSKNYYLPL